MTDLRRNGETLCFTGPSLEAVLATLAVATNREKSRSVRALYTFGSPRVCNSDFQ